MLGSNPGSLQLVHWQSDALTARLDLIRSWLDLIRMRLSDFQFPSFFYFILTVASVLDPHWFQHGSRSVSSFSIQWEHGSGSNADPCCTGPGSWSGLRSHRRRFKKKKIGAGKKQVIKIFRIRNNSDAPHVLHYNENSKHFPEMKLHGLRLQFLHSCICERFIYSSRLVLGRPILGMYKSFTDT
jgi:hypothetical protein